MGMIFKLAAPVKLMSVRNHEKDGKKYSFVKFGDPQTLESSEFKLDRDIDPFSLEVGQMYTISLDVDGRYSNITPQRVKA